MKILVVDDSRAALGLIKDSLKESGFEVCFTVAPHKLAKDKSKKSFLKLKNCIFLFDYEK